MATTYTSRHADDTEAKVRREHLSATQLQSPTVGMLTRSATSPSRHPKSLAFWSSARVIHDATASNRSVIAPLDASPVTTATATTSAAIRPTDRRRSLSFASGQVRQFKIHEWNTELFSCLENVVPNALMSWCCPIVALAQIYARLGIASYRTMLLLLSLLAGTGCFVHWIPIREQRNMDASTPPELLSGESWHWFITAQVLALLSAIVIARRHTRSRYQISGNMLADVWASCCCPCCAIAQIATHIRSYKRGSCAFTAPDELPAFQ